MKLCAARDALISIFDLHSIAADRYVRALQDTGALPPAAATVDVEHLGRLVLAVLASTTPSDAVDALATFEALELLVVERRERAGDGRLQVTEVQIANEADVPVHMGGARARWFALAEAMPLVIEAGGVNEITVRRTPPLAIITLGGIRLLYGRRTCAARSAAACDEVAHVAEWVTLATSGIEQISALLTGLPHVPASEGQAVPMVH